MAFFSDDKLKPRKIEIDQSTVSSDSDQIRSRLDRIRNNYDRLREIFTELEVQIEADERLSAINETLDDATLDSAVQKKSKRRWRGKSTNGSAKHTSTTTQGKSQKPR